MILFLDDWKKFPTAVVHRETTNTSWLRMAELYRTMGIKNHVFHLSLLQPDLANVDPYSKTLSKEQMIMIGTECRYNPWYYFREVARIAPQAGYEPWPVKANRGNIALWWCFFNHIDISLIQPRQSGKSVSVDTLIDYIMDVAAVNTNINLLTKDDQLRKKQISRIKKVREFKPTYLKTKTRKDTDNKEELSCVALNNYLSTAVGQNNELSANNVGRGLTSPIQLIDEPPFINYIDVTIPAMLSSASAARDEAMRSNALYGNIFTTTAGKKDTRSGRYMYELISKALPWTEELYDLKNQQQLKTIVEKHCDKKYLINATFSHRQLGYTDEWLVDTIRTVGATPEEADRDFFNVWTSGTTMSPLSVEMNKIIRQSERDPSYTEITPEGYTIRWYVEKDQIEHYMKTNTCIVGSDTSEGVGRDSMTMVVVNVKTLDVVAATHFNEINIIRFISFISDFMLKYERTILIPERRSTGQTVIDSLLITLPNKGIDPFKRIFNRIVNEHGEREEDYKIIRATAMNRRSNAFYDKYKADFGYATAGSGKYTRTALYSDVLQMAADKGGNLIKDKPLINEITSLMVKNGRIDHILSGHDDMVIAWLLCNWMLMFGRNLSFYGIENPLSEVLGSKEVQTDSVDRKMKLLKKHRQQEVKEEIATLLEKLRETPDEFLSVRYENRLRYLDSKLDHNSEDVKNMDDLIRIAKEKKSIAKRHNRDTALKTTQTKNIYYRR